MKIFADNQKARFNYQIIESFEAGLLLSGHQLKAIKAGQASIKGAYVKILGGEAWLLGATVSPYQPANLPKDYDPQKNIKLLLKSKELDYLFGRSQEQGLTLAPVKIYGKGNLVKLQIAVARGKKKHDKRESIKKRDTEREIARKVRG